MAVVDDFNSGLMHLRQLVPKKAIIRTKNDEQYEVSCITGKISDVILSNDSRLNKDSLKVKFLKSDLLDANELNSGVQYCPLRKFDSCNIIYKSVVYNVVQEDSNGNFDSEVTLYISRVG